MTPPTDPLDVAAMLDHIADHISETLYSFGHHIDDHSYGKTYIRHDDYDQLRFIAKRIRHVEYSRLAEKNK